MNSELRDLHRLTDDLGTLLADEDLTDAKLRAAADTLLPLLSDALQGLPGGRDDSRIFQILTGSPDAHGRYLGLWGHGRRPLITINHYRSAVDLIEATYRANGDAWCAVRGILLNHDHLLNELQNQIYERAAQEISVIKLEGTLLKTCCATPASTLGHKAQCPTVRPPSWWRWLRL